MSRRARRPNRGNALGAALIALTMAALAGLVAAGLLLRPPPTDETTLCRRDLPIAAHTLILVDATDRLESRHRRLLAAVARQEQARLARYDRLTLMRLDARRPQEPRVLFSKCLPLPPERANPLFHNPRQTQQAWDASFEDALESALRSAQSGGPNRASPILAGLRAVAADPEFSASIARRRLVLVSDLLEHNPEGFSLYAAGADFDRWRAQSPTEPADLSAIDLRVVPIDRPDVASRQTEARDKFWRPYFDAAGAQSLEIDPAP